MTKGSLHQSFGLWHHSSNTRTFYEHNGARECRAAGRETDGETGGKGEHVAVDVEREEYILVVVARRSSVGLAMKQYLLAVKDTHDTCSSGDQGTYIHVYGFVTAGKKWRMVTYGGG